MSQKKARKRHEKAVPLLEKRVASLGFTSTNLRDCLSYIQHDAPIVIHLPETALFALAQDTHYRNLFETNTSGGRRDKDIRARWERRMFGSAYDRDDCNPFDRPKYWCLNFTGDYTGVKKAKKYGKLCIFLSPDIRHRATFFHEDTGNCFKESSTLATSEYYAHVLHDYTGDDLKAAIEVACISRMKGAASRNSSYKEVQIHGPVCLASDIQALSVPGREQEASKDLIHLVSNFRRKSSCMVIWQGDLLPIDP